MISDKDFETLVDIIEKMVDTRFQYLVELGYENHTFARKILKDDYEPLKLELRKILGEGLDKR